MGWKECDYKKIQRLKQDKKLELPWDFLEDGERIFSYEGEDTDIAFIRISVDPIDECSLWIDEFEVIGEYRKKGNGIIAISKLIEDSPSDIKLMAKNKQVQQFWEKCGFEDDGITWAEIPMIYRKVH